MMRCPYRQCVAFCRPGKTLRELHQLSIQLLSEGLADLGVCGRMGPASIAQNAYSTFYPHSVGKLIPLVSSTCNEADLWPCLLLCFLLLTGHISSLVLFCNASQKVGNVSHHVSTWQTALQVHMVYTQHGVGAICICSDICSSCYPMQTKTFDGNVRPILSLSASSIRAVSGPTDLCIVSPPSQALQLLQADA